MAISIVPTAAFVEEVSFDLLALASRSGPTIDTRDWTGSTQPDFTENRQFGFPLLEGVIRPAVGNVNLVLEYGLPTFPIAEPPVLAFSPFATIGAAVGAWTPLSFRVTSRFARLTVTDTSGGANAGVYLVAFLRGA